MKRGKKIYRLWIRDKRGEKREKNIENENSWLKVNSQDNKK